MGNQGEINLDEIEKASSSAASLRLFQGSVTPKAFGASHNQTTRRGKKKNYYDTSKNINKSSESILASETRLDSHPPCDWQLCALPDGTRGRASGAKYSLG